MRVVEQTSVMQDIIEVPNNKRMGRVTFSFQTAKQTAQLILDNVKHMLWAEMWVPELVDDTEFCVIKPAEFQKENPSSQLREAEELWLRSMRESEESFVVLLDLGCSLLTAESVLPDSREVTLTIAAGLEQWLAIFRSQVTGIQFVETRVGSVVRPAAEEAVRQLLGLALRQIVDSTVGDMFQSVADTVVCEGG